MNKILHRILIALALPLWGLGGFSCYEDKGNYDYHELEVVAIDTPNADVQILEEALGALGLTPSSFANLETGMATVMSKAPVNMSPAFA